uniref:Uncharacterized protein n=2 Tax=Setaria TaxID=4554 RepID=K3XU32_SETIT|nr:hypothetical protein SEVIR_5G123350v2 [Setaria viridis]
MRSRNWPCMSPRTLMGASSSRRFGCRRNTALAPAQSCQISPSASSCCSESPAPPEEASVEEVVLLRRMLHAASREMQIGVRIDRIGAVERGAGVGRRKGAVGDQIRREDDKVVPDA